MTILDMKEHRSNQKILRKIGLNNKYDIYMISSFNIKISLLSLICSSGV